jgi:hypothetical protein
LSVGSQVVVVVSTCPKPLEVAVDSTTNLRLPRQQALPHTLESVVRQISDPLPSVRDAIDDKGALVSARRSGRGT